MLFAIACAALLCAAIIATSGSRRVPTRSLVAAPKARTLSARERHGSALRAF